MGRFTLPVHHGGYARWLMTAFDPEPPDPNPMPTIRLFGHPRPAAPPEDDGP